VDHDIAVRSPTHVSECLRILKLRSVKREQLSSNTTEPHPVRVRLLSEFPTDGRGCRERNRTLTGCGSVVFWESAKEPLTHVRLCFDYRTVNSLPMPSSRCERPLAGSGMLHIAA
jgi:hypothetical protein